MVWKNEWGGDIFFSHGSNHSRGVCILANPKFAISVDEFHRDRDGRIVSINVSFNKSQFSICNVYAPVKPTEQENFVQGLNEFLLRNVNVDKLIIGGDWNVTLEQIDKKGGARWEPTAYRNKLAPMMKDLDLTDIFREKKPKKLSFTYESKFLKVKSRIDFFLVGNALRNSVIEIDTKASIAPDHKAVKLCLQFTNHRRGPGLWKFNNMLLKDDNFVCLIKENYPSIINKYREVHDKRLFWELIKMKIRSLTIPYSKNKARQNRLKESNILKRIEELDVLICNSNNLQDIDSELNEYERLKRDLQRHYELKGESAIFRSKVRWTQHGEKPTKYFFNLEKKNFNQRVIAEIKTTPDGSAIVDETEILIEIQRFYADQYKSDSEENSDVADFDAFTHELHLPKLSNAERDALEGMLTIEECKTTLRTFSLGKSPGEDGFTVEFYNTFYEILGQDLVNSLNESYELGELSISQRRGVISLVPKEDSNLLLLSNWRPITLLNVDYKIASKTIAKRIENVLPKLIHTDQTGFIKGRYIGQNIRLLIDILDETKLQEIPGILLLLDFKNAFDTIEWSFIQQTLKIFNFGESVQQWVSTFYTNSESSVLNNGFTTDYFRLSRGVRQGCPLSPFLFILGAEILANKIRQSKNVSGIHIYQHEFKISQFADDTSLLCKDIISVENAITLLLMNSESSLG